MVFPLITCMRRWVAFLLHVPITWYGRANIQVQPVAVGHVLFLLFQIFFPNIITPEEKLGCSEKRWMMQYSANPIMYVLVKCVARLSPPPLSLWTFVKHLLLYTNRIGQGLQRNLGGFSGKEWWVIRSVLRLEWVEEELSMWTFDQVFTFNHQAKPSVFAGHSSVLQPARACWVGVLMRDNPHVDRRMDDGKFCKFNRWALLESVCRCEWLLCGAICPDQSGISVHLYPRQFITPQLSGVGDMWEMQDYVF